MKEKFAGKGSRDCRRDEQERKLSDSCSEMEYIYTHTHVNVGLDLSSSEGSWKLRDGFLIINFGDECVGTLKMMSWKHVVLSWVLTRNFLAIASSMNTALDLFQRETSCMYDL